MITFTTWKWGTKYGPEYVNRLARGIIRNTQRTCQIICITDDPVGIDQNIVRTIDISVLGGARVLCSIDDGCYARLAMFAPDFQRHLDAYGLRVHRVINLDLDAVVTGDLTPIMSRAEPLSIGFGIHALPIYNGSIMSLELGAYPEVWEDFSVERARAVAWAYPGTPAKIYAGTDQSWIWHKLAERAEVGRFTPFDGVYGYAKPGWYSGGDLMPNARIVFFPGARDPGSPQVQARSPWIQEHWT